ncbi:unnamed protein product [Macrosiphum euphorbiae]|uniref:Uncharacterized protein n=1 Tax=Macrosiphum euphorbiae TaxID=13131 RepID=A0AAV0VZ18_9HEMI|nr:unnamed protein product [Macrosiphum euphorbiae]
MDEVMHALFLTHIPTGWCIFDKQEECVQEETDNFMKDYQKTAKIKLVDQNVPGNDRNIQIKNTKLDDKNVCREAAMLKTFIVCLIHGSNRSAWYITTI